MNEGINEWINEWLSDPKAKLRALFIYTAKRWSQTKFQPIQQGRMNGNPVADGWAGAVMQKPLAIQKCYGRIDGPTDTARCRVACPRLKIFKKYGSASALSNGFVKWRCQIAVCMLKSLQIKYICWVLPLREYITSLNQIGMKNAEVMNIFHF